MVHRRLHTAAVVAIACAVVASGPARAAEDPAASQPLPARFDDAVARGLDYLARQQNPGGSFAAGRNPDGTPGAVPAPPMAATGLALHAFLSAGHAPDVGRHGYAVRNAIDFLVAGTPDDGYAGAVPADQGDTSGMHGQAVVTLALAEAYGVEQDRDRRLRMRATVQRTLKVILTAQAVSKPEGDAGGWGATRDATSSDLWTTGWNVLALRTCREAGFDVPPDALERAAQYVLRCRNPSDKGFAARPGGPGEFGPAGVGVTSLYQLGAGDRPEAADASKFLARHAVDAVNPAAATTTPATTPTAAAPATTTATTTTTTTATATTTPTTTTAPATTNASTTTAPTTAPRAPVARHAHYANYAAVHASLLAGEPAWSAVSKPVFEALLSSQSPDGGWPASAAPEEPGRSYATAMNVLSLTVSYRLLPAYAR